MGVTYLVGLTLYYGVEKRILKFYQFWQKLQNGKSSHQKEATMIQISAEPLSPLQGLANLKTSNAGSVVIHVGLVRPFSEGKKVVSIEYHADR
jgi:hypothetical protein